MKFEQLREFRQLAYQYLGQAKDATFELVQLGVNTQTIRQPRLYPYMST
jgi:hypothetical protein